MPDRQDASLWDRMQVWAAKGAPPAAVPPAQTDLPAAAQAVRADEGYLRLTLSEMRVADGPCVIIAAVRLRAGDAEATLFRVMRVTGNHAGEQGRILMDWLPYRGGEVQASVAVLAFPASADAALDNLEARSADVGTPLPQAPAHSAQVETGLRALLKGKKAPVRIAWTQALAAGARVSPGYFAAWGESAAADASALSVRDGRLLARGLGVPGSFLLARVDTVESRDDVHMPETDAQLRRALEAILQDDRRRGPDAAAQALSGILSSPDLVRVDRQRIAAAVSDLLAEIVDAPHGAVGGALPTLADVIATRARPASALRNKPELGLGDLMAPLRPQPLMRATPGEDAPPPERFEAFPLLKAPERVAPDEEFPVTVGFGTTPDTTLTDQQQIVVEHPAPGVPLLVTITSFELDVLGDDMAEIPLAMEASHVFRCKPKPGVSSARIRATYFYQRQCVGFAERDLAVGMRARSAPALPKAPVPACRMQMPLPPELAVDLEVHLSHHESAEGSRLHWELMATKPPLHWKAEGPSLPNAAGFAARLITLMDSGATGQFAINALQTIGQDIRAKIPQDFFALLEDVREAVRADPARAAEKPTLLWYTDTETFIPWELALMPESKPGAPLFLGQAVRMGRWLQSEGIQQPPPVHLDVQQITAVASAYGLDTLSGLRSLDFALPERKSLHEMYGAAEVDATQAGIEPLFAADARAGHLIHFAVHGTSIPKADSHYLALEDRSQLHPEMLVGTPYQCGDTPRFAFVFINACQVGTSGEVLGVAAGFPGRIVRSGACGFVAPLWSVVDEDAHALALRFYKETLGAGGMTVGEALRSQRDPFDPKRGTTPMAYVYYGHPNLRLKRV